MLYAADGKWWRHDNGGICIDRVRAGFTGSLWTCDRGAAGEFGLNKVQVRPDPGICTEGGTLHSGASNGGLQAVNLAWQLYQPQRLVLLGYDMQASNGVPHWHGKHAAKLGDPSPPLLARWAVAAAAVARDLQELGTEVWNCSRLSAAQGWPKANLEDICAVVA